MEPNTPSPSVGESPEQVPVQTGDSKTFKQQPEQGPAPQERTVQHMEQASQNPVMALPSLPVIPVQQPIQKSQNDEEATTKSGQNLDTPDIADDVDVIEKQWVNKAKEIVHRNSDNPYKQNQEVSMLKADYMKKRYGKDIKLADEQAS